MVGDPHSFLFVVESSFLFYVVFLGGDFCLAVLFAAGCWASQDSIFFGVRGEKGGY